MIETERYPPQAIPGYNSTAAPGAVVTLQGAGQTLYGAPTTLSYAWSQVSGPTVALSDATDRNASFTVPANAADNTRLTFRLTVTDPSGASKSADVGVTVRAPGAGPKPERTTACFTYLGRLNTAVEYAGAYGLGVTCKSHHQTGGGAIRRQDGSLVRLVATQARYFNFTLTEETQVSVNLSGGWLFVSKDTPQRGWGTRPAPFVTYEERNAKRNANGKLVHSGSNSATLTLAAGKYTVEVAGGGTIDGRYIGHFTVSVTPLSASGSSGSPPTADAGLDLSGSPGEEVTLQGTGSVNPHGEWWQLRHQWTQLSSPKVTLTHPNATSQKPADRFGDPRFIVPSNAATGTKLVFKLTVTDQDGESDSDTMTVTVTGN